MTKPKHSPAPWIVKETTYGIKHIYSARDDEGYMTSIAAVYNSGPETKPFDEAVIRHAPELLVAVKDVLALIGRDKLSAMSREEQMSLAASLGNVVRLAEGKWLR